MIVSRLAIALAQRFHADLLDEISYASLGEPFVDLNELLSGKPSKEEIVDACLFRKQSAYWTLSVFTKQTSYRETSLNDASIIFADRLLPATIMLACSNRSIPVTQIVEPSSTFDPFFLRNDVLVESITQLYRVDRDSRRVPALKLAVTF